MTSSRGQKRSIPDDESSSAVSGSSVITTLGCRTRDTFSGVERKKHDCGATYRVNSKGRTIKSTPRVRKNKKKINKFVILYYIIVFIVLVVCRCF